MGNRFTVADLTAASFLASIIEIDCPAFTWPKPLPQALAALFDRTRDHPGADWTRSMYARHRGAAIATDGGITYAS